MTIEKILIILLIAEMNIKTTLIMIFIAEIFLIFIGRDLILKLAKKLDEVVEELRNNN